MTASQKVHLRRCPSSFVIAAYFYVRFIPQDSRALHLELFPVSSTLATFYEVINGQWDDQVCYGADFEDVTEVLCVECGEELPEDMATIVKFIAFSFLTSNLDFAEWGSAFPNRLLGAASSTGSAMVPIGSSSMATVIALQNRFPNHQKCGLRKEVKCTKTEASPRPQIDRFQVAPLPRSWVASLGRSVTSFRISA